MVTIHSANAFTAFCSLNEKKNFVAYSKAEFECTTGGRESIGTLEIDLVGIDAQIRYDGRAPVDEEGRQAMGTGTAEGLILTCPLVSKKRLHKVINKRGFWGGVGLMAGAGVIGSVKAGVGFNHRGAACLIMGGSVVVLPEVAAGFVRFKISY